MNRLILGNQTKKQGKEQHKIMQTEHYLKMFA